MLDEKEVVDKRIAYLEDRHWIDRQTESVIVKILFYNGQLKPLLTEASELLPSSLSYVSPRPHVFMVLRVIVSWCLLEMRTIRDKVSTSSSTERDSSHLPL